MTKPIPEGYHTITPSLTFRDTQRAIEYYKRAFAAEVTGVHPRPNGGIMHATLQIGNSIIMMGDEMPGAECLKSAETVGSSPISLYLYVTNVDAVFAQALAAGGSAAMPVEDMFWGDRVGQIKDPFGYQWMIATHKKDLSDDEVRKGAEAFFARMQKK